MNIMAIGNYQTTDNNKRVNNLAFKALHNGYWKEESLRILERTPAEVRELGEYFHKSTPDELEKVARRSNFLGIKKKRESNWALNVLNNAIEQVVESKKTMQRTLDELINKDSVSTYICLYGNQSVTLTALTKLLCNEYKPTGELPIDKSLFE